MQLPMPAGRLPPWGAARRSVLATYLLCCALLQGSGDPLRGVKYTCNVTDDLARKTAARLGLQLQNYVQ